MAKTELTLQLEKDICMETNKMGVFGCFEVTIGFGGRERVDYLTYDTKGIWRCYEIKVSKSDFHSKCKKTFIGNYNYYVMTQELYDEVKDEIPKHIGVYCGRFLVKKPKKQELQVDEQILKDSMIRSLFRDAQKVRMSENVDIMNRLQSQLNEAKKDIQLYQNKTNEYSTAIFILSDKYNISHKEVRSVLRGEYNE